MAAAVTRCCQFTGRNIQEKCVSSTSGLKFADYGIDLVYVVALIAYFSLALKRSPEMMNQFKWVRDIAATAAVVRNFLNVARLANDSVKLHKDGKTWEPIILAAKVLIAAGRVLVTLILLDKLKVIRLGNVGTQFTNQALVCTFVPATLLLLYKSIDRMVCDPSKKNLGALVGDLLEGGALGIESDLVSAAAPAPVMVALLAINLASIAFNGARDLFEQPSQANSSDPGSPVEGHGPGGAGYGAA